MASIKRLASQTVSRNPAPKDDEEIENDEGEEGESVALATIEYSKAELAMWDGLEAIERIALSEIMVKAAYGAIVVGNIIERVELKNGPGKSKTNPDGDWYCYRIELIRPLGPIDDPETGEVIEAKPGDYVLVPETARLAALTRFVGCCVALRPKGTKALKGKKAMWLYEGVLISRERMDPDAPLVTNTPPARTRG
jgi:hypothetical protein